jgi:exonuclease SbcD
MRFIHTADWHLGRIFHGIHLTEDQSHVLEQVIALVHDTRPDLFLISGDVYDRAVPPPEAVKLFGRVLSSIALDLKIPVIIISGNHDSPERLTFASDLLAAQNVYLTGSINQIVNPLVLKDKYGDIMFFPLPYAEPALVREKFCNEKARDHGSSMEIMLERIKEEKSPDVRSVLLSHSFVTGSSESDSERPLFAGKLSTVDAEKFYGFNYVALGHLHSPQILSEGISYSGSLLKYSFSEVNHKTGVNLVEIDGRGKCRIEKIPLSPERDLRIIEGYLNDIVSVNIDGGNRNDYIKVILLDKEPILDMMGKLRGVYPNILHVERKFDENSGISLAPLKGYKNLSDEEFFSNFYEEVTGDELTVEQSELYIDIVSRLRMEEREAGI